MLIPAVVQPQDTDARVTSLADGLTFGTLVRTIRSGVVAFDNTSALAPPTVAGVKFWGAAVSHLREELLPTGWGVQNDRNFSVVVSPCEKVRIACSRGSEQTGSFDIKSNPTTRSKKGPKTISAIHANACQGQGVLDLFGPPDRCLTWFLLYNRKDNLVFSELSLPGSFSSVHRRPDGWIERIPLPAISVDPAEFEPLHSAPDVEVTVKRRS